MLDSIAIETTRRCRCTLWLASLITSGSARVPRRRVPRRRGTTAGHAQQRVLPKRLPTITAKTLLSEIEVTGIARKIESLVDSEVQPCSAEFDATGRFMVC